jgi:GGDEF-like domain
VIARAVDRVTGDRAVVSGMIAQVVDGVEAELDSFAAGVEDRVLARIQAAHGGLSVALKEALRRGVRAAVRDALARLRSQAELPHELPPELGELARIQAGLRSDPPELADAWLVGQEVFWHRFELMAERTLGDSALCWEVMKAARLQLSGHAARLSRLYRSACEAELARATGIRDDTRLHTVSRALDGHWVDVTELGYDLAYHHVAVVADASTALDALARRSERHLLVVAAPAGRAWGWLGGRSRISDSELDAVVAWQRTREDGPAAFGEPAAGIAGFASSHQQALEARAIAAASGQRAVRFGDLRLLAAVLRDGELAKGFIERELGELDDPNERMRELRATLRAYLEHSQSVSATAALRRRDRKTIVRQLRSAERLIRHRVSDRSDELLMALRVADILRQRG